MCDCKTGRWWSADNSSDPHGLEIAHQDGHLRTLSGLGDEVEVSQEGRGGIGARRWWGRRTILQLCLSLLVLGLQLQLQMRLLLLRSGGVERLLLQGGCMVQRGGGRGELRVHDCASESGSVAALVLAIARNA